MKYQLALATKLIYVFRINDHAHEGCLKIGEATVDDDNLFDLNPNCSILNKAAKKRIDQYTQTAGICYDLLYTEVSIYSTGGKLYAFNDKEVHDVLKRSGIKQKFFNIEAKANEWFITDLETVKKAIAAVKKGHKSLTAAEISQEQSPIVFRPEQQDAINKTKKQFKKNDRMLWNAKMRFGKTLTALQVVKEMDFTRTLILTHRPVVNAGWFEDFKKIFYDRPDFAYGSRTSGESFETLEKAVKKSKKHYVYFASIQDMRGSERTGGKFDKNDAIFDTTWDLIIVDEAHEGTQTELGQNVLAELKKETSKVLELSGTPFNLLNGYKEDEIYTWDYVMEQRAKKEWDILHFGDPNPYAALPRMNIYTFDLGERFAEFADEELAFNFREFFRVNDNGEFIHNCDVLAFLNLICQQDQNSNYPFSKQEYRDNFRHSLWRIPGVKEGKALSAMLKEHPVFGQFEIVNVAGDGDEDERREEALQMVKNAIKGNDYTITLSCGRLTTGVSVPEWTAVFMLEGVFNTSASSYMQTIFRAQTPAVINGKVKEECFVFDFAPDRTLKVLAEAAAVSKKAGRTTGDDRQKIGEFLNFCPVISCQGTVMEKYDVDQMLGQLKKVYIERVVRGGFDDNYLYNGDMLINLSGKDLSNFNDLKKTIGATKAMPKSGDIDINNQGFTDEQYEKIEELEEKKRQKKELTAEELAQLERLKQQKKQKENAISILRGISIRMPLIIYGAELKDETQEITIDNFTELIDKDSWAEFMPRGVTKSKFSRFKKFYDPVVFKESGKRIRSMAKAADSLPPKERIERITTIFSYFRNPDKETVLTPWRVVNMHMSESFGGYSFYDDQFEKVLSEPRYVDKGNVTSEVFSSQSRVLEINSKSGLYPLYMAYSIYRTRYNRKDEASISEQYTVWDKVLAENIFVICKTPMAKSITKRTLGGFRKCQINARYFENLIKMLKSNEDRFIRKINRTSYWGILGGNKKMNFDAIVGNPPYQVMAKGKANGSDPIYHLFIDVARRISNRGSFIHPGRFLFNAGKTPKDWNERILNDKHFKIVKYWAKSVDIFPTVDIPGGIAVTYWDNKVTYSPIGLFISHDCLKTILKKVKTQDAVFLPSIMFPQTKFKLEKLYADYPHYKNIIGSGGNDKRLRPNAFEKLDVFTETSQHGMCGIQGLINNKRVIRFIPRKYLEDNSTLDRYSVLVPKANGSGAIGEVSSTPLIGDPLINPPLFGYTGSFIGIGTFSNENDAEACMKYIKTKFARVMLGTLKVTQDNPIETWANVPSQDFTANSDIDWSVPVSEIDQQLYSKYALSEDEIAFIESNIKPLE